MDLSKGKNGEKINYYLQNGANTNRATNPRNSVDWNKMDRNHFTFYVSLNKFITCLSQLTTNTISPHIRIFPFYGISLFIVPKILPFWFIYFVCLLCVAVASLHSFCDIRTIEFSLAVYLYNFWIVVEKRRSEENKNWIYYPFVLVKTVVQWVKLNQCDPTRMNESFWLADMASNWFKHVFSLFVLLFAHFFSLSQTIPANNRTVEHYSVIYPRDLISQCFRLM